MAIVYGSINLPCKRIVLRFVHFQKKILIRCLKFHSAISCNERRQKSFQLGHFRNYWNGRFLRFFSFYILSVFISVHLFSLAFRDFDESYSKICVCQMRLKTKTLTEKKPQVDGKTKNRLESSGAILYFWSFRLFFWVNAKNIFPALTQKKFTIYLSNWTLFNCPFPLILQRWYACTYAELM